MGWAVLRYYAFGLTWRRSCSQQDDLEAKWERWEGAWHGSLLGMVSVPKAIQPVCLLHDLGTPPGNDQAGDKWEDLG